MDLSTKIIKGVRQFPSLYDSNGNLDERNQAWMQLAEKLQMHEVNLKIRWHSLMQEYQRNINFKYANEMSFVQRIKTHAKVESWPEFIITEEDLKDDRPEQEREEFVFLERDEEEKIKNLSEESANENETHYKEPPKQLEEISTHDELKNKHEENSDSKIIVQNKTINEALEETVTDKSETIAITTTSKVEEKMAAVDVNKSDEPCIKESKEIQVVKSQVLPIERCEDVIFGELVSAMLKRMEENKKNNIKREIMNLLFS